MKTSATPPQKASVLPTAECSKASALASAELWGPAEPRIESAGNGWWTVTLPGAPCSQDLPSRREAEVVVAEWRAERVVDELVAQVSTGTTTEAERACAETLTEASRTLLHGTTAQIVARLEEHAAHADADTAETLRWAAGEIAWDAEHPGTYGRAKAGA